MGKRGPKKGQGGRPLGSGLGQYAGGPAKYPEEVRAVWRSYYHSRKGMVKVKPPSGVLREPSPVQRAIGMKSGKKRKKERGKK